MIKIKYKIDPESLVNNPEEDLSDYEELTVYFDTVNGLSLVMVNNSLVVNNSVLAVTNLQKVQENVTPFKSN